VTIRDVGDRVNIQYLSYNAAGTLTNATVALAVTDPAGAVTNPSVTNTSTGQYDAAFTLASAGLWTWTWTVSGAVVDVGTGSVFAADPGPPTYASMAELKSYVGGLATSDTTDDAKLQDALISASRGIEHFCGRAFWPALVASARTFHPRTLSLAVVDDFWTATGLIVKTDGSDSGTFGTTWTTADYSLEPANGVVSGEPGWPYYRIVAVNRDFPCGRRPSVQVTAKWGWPTVPGPVRQACLVIAAETFKLKDSPFGVGGYGQFGIIRVRDNPMAARMLAPYQRDPVLVA
jgi:hypothetical protein